MYLLRYAEFETACFSQRPEKNSIVFKAFNTES